MAPQQPAAALAAVETLLAQPDLDDIAQAGTLTCKLIALQTNGQGDAALAVIDRLLPLVEPATIPAPIRMNARLQAAGALQSLQHQQQRTLEVLEAVLTESRAVGEAQATINALAGIGLTRASHMDDAAGALPYLEQAVTLSTQMHGAPPMGEATMRYNLAYALLSLKRYARADAEFQQIQRLLGPDAHDQTLAARVDSHRGEILRATGRTAQARDRLAAAMVVQERLGDTHGQTVTLMRLARIALDEGELEHAQQDAEHALALADRGRFVVETRDALELLVSILAARGDTAGVARYSERIQAMERERDRAAGLETLARLQAEVEREMAPQGATSQDLRRAQVLRDASLVLLALLLVGGGGVLLRMRARQRQLRNLGSTDALTGLPNRREATARIDAMIAAHPGGEERRCVLLMLDIDGFKAINDQHGHAVGDEALQHVAGALRDAIDSHDILARWGGEEFLIARADSSREAAFALAEHLRTAVERRPLPLPGGSALAITVSIGVAPCPFFPQTRGKDGWQGDLRLADRALYVAKHAGRNAWAGIWGLAEGRDVDLYSVRQNPQTALAQGWIVIGGNRPMSWAPVREDGAPIAPRRPVAVSDDGLGARQGNEPR